MPLIDVAVVPGSLTPQHLHGHVAVIVDAMRSTTATLAALAAGAKDVRLFASIDLVREQAEQFDDPSLVLMAGDVAGQMPSDFEAAVSPADLNPKRVEGKTVLLFSPNGSGAVEASRPAKTAYVAAMANISPMAQRLSNVKDPITFVCAGWNGQLAEEDIVVAGAIIDRLQEDPQFETTPSANFAHNQYSTNRENLRALFATSQSGQRLRDLGLTDDIDLCAEVDLYPAMGILLDDPLRVVPMGRSHSQASGTMMIPPLPPQT